MKKNNGYIYLALLLFLGSCDCCGGKIIALCDLAINIFDAPDSITVGQVFKTTTDIFNQEDEADCTKTEASDVTNMLIKLLRQVSPGDDDISNWEPVWSEDDFDVPALSPEEMAEVIAQMRINYPGNYAYGVNVNPYESLSERNFYNNEYLGYGKKEGTTPLNSKKSNNVAYKIIQVLPVEGANDSLMYKKYEGEYVSFISYEVTIKKR